MTAEGWAEEALDLLFQRVEETAEQVGTRFPLYADPADGRWTTTGRGSWTGGFWAGLLRLRARHTGVDAHYATATAATARLAQWADADTATRGLILWYGTAAFGGEGEALSGGEGATLSGAEGTPPAGGVGAALSGGEAAPPSGGEVTPSSAREVTPPAGGKAVPSSIGEATSPSGAEATPPAGGKAEPPAGQDAAATTLRARAARAVLAAWDPRLGLVPWGAALGGSRLRARADGVPGLVPLLAAAGPEGRAAAAAHLHRHLDLCLPGEGAGRPCPAWRWDEEGGWVPEADPAPGWTRGEAWLLLAVADAFLHDVETTTWGTDRLTRAAELLLDRCEFLAGPLVPPAETPHPDGPLDTSAAAIAAVALLKLALIPGAASAPACADRAEAVLQRLARTHVSRPGGPGPAGMLLDGCYEAGSGTAVRHELVWGDFFLALGLSALLGRVDLRRV